MVVISKIYLGLILIVSFLLTFTDTTYIHAMNKEEYDIITELVKNDGRLLVPPNERTKTQRSVNVKYWRLKENLSLHVDGLLLFQGRRVLKKCEIKRCVSKTFEKASLQVTRNFGREL